MINMVTLVGKVSTLPFESTAGIEGHPYAFTVKTDDTSFDIHIWEKLADIIAEKFGLDTMVGIKGQLVKANGSIHIIAERVSFVSQASEGDA